MSEAAPTMSHQAEGSTSPAAPRTTGRTRVKSQRVLEAEDTKRFLKNQVTDVPSSAAVKDSKPASRAHGKGKGKKRVEEEVYCICRKDADGPMIECGECNDWFHFTCIGLAEDEAEKILKFVCPGCEASTGQRTTHSYDIASFPSPSPPPGVTPAKRKKSKPKAAKRTPSRTPSNVSGSDSESEAEIESASSRHSSPEPAPKRPRPSIDNKRKPSVDRKPSVSIGGLPPVRKYVQDKLAPAFAGLFGTTDDGKARSLATDVEGAIYYSFKEIIGGKETAGTRYKDITNGSLSPAQIATLTSADLASAEQLAEIEKAKQAALQQTVRAKEEFASVRLGRDGFEKVENVHEKEMNLIAEQEETTRFRAEEAAKKALEPVEVAESPIADAPRFAPRRSESTDVASPLRQTSFALNSAWGKDKDGDAKEELMFSGDQTDLDLSDIAQGEVVIDDLFEEKVLEDKMTEMEEFEAKPVVWQGGLFNPANPSPHVPPMELRIVSRAPSLNWDILLPHKTVEITGRVGTAASLQFLSDSRLNPAKELVTVAFSPAPTATNEELSEWEQMVQYHIGRDRHAIYLPYGRDVPPPGAAKELYMIPLRPTDPSPEITDLIDGYCLPATGRTTSVFLGVFISNKNLPPASATPAEPIKPATPNVGAAPSAPVIRNEQLQALMASLNPAALQGALSGSPLPQTAPYTPIPVPNSTTPPQGGNTPSYPYPQGYGGHSPYPPYPPHRAPYQARDRDLDTRDPRKRGRQ